MSDLKQVIVVRADLGMDKGKIASQVAHASLEAYKTSDPGERKEWEEGGSKKVVLKTPDPREFADIQRKLKGAGVPFVLIRDAGKTQIRPGTVTAMGIGPVREEEIDRITGHLKLL